MSTDNTEVDAGPETRGLQLIGNQALTPERVGQMADQHIQQGVEVAKRLAAIIKKQGLEVQIQQGARPHVRYEGWATLARLVGLDIAISECHYEEQGEPAKPGYVFGFRATAQLLDREGRLVGSATSGCYSDERWGKRDRYTMESMAQTRAAGKACRLKLSWIMQLAGYEATPAEEMSSMAPDRAPGPSESAPRTQEPAGGVVDWEAMKQKLLTDYAQVNQDPGYRPSWLRKPIAFGKMKGKGYLWVDGIGDTERARQVRRWIHACQAKGLERATKDGWDPGDFSSVESCKWAPHEIAGRIVLSIHSWVSAAMAQQAKQEGEIRE